MIGNILDNVLKDGQKIYCKTKEEVDCFMDIAEAKGLRWENGDEIKQHFDGYPIIYEIDETMTFPNKVYFNLRPSAKEIRDSITAINLLNYAISIRNKRS